MREQIRTVHAINTHVWHEEGSRDTQYCDLLCVRPPTAFIPCKQAMFRPIDRRNNHHRCHHDAKIARYPVAIHEDQIRPFFPVLAWLITEAEAEQPSPQSPPASPVYTQGTCQDPGRSLGWCMSPWDWCMSSLCQDTRTSGTQIKGCSPLCPHVSVNKTSHVWIDTPGSGTCGF